MMAITGLLALNGWEGYTEQVVEVVGQTPKRLRIRAITCTRLAGPRWLEPGQTEPPNVTAGDAPQALIDGWLSGIHHVKAHIKALLEQP